MENHVENTWALQISAVSGGIYSVTRSGGFILKGFFLGVETTNYTHQKMNMEPAITFLERNIIFKPYIF